MSDALLRGNNYSTIKVVEKAAKYFSFVLITVFVTPTFGHFVYEEYEYMVGDDPFISFKLATDGCVKARLEVSHGGAGAGYYKTEMRLLKNPSDRDAAIIGIPPCGEKYNSLAAGQFKARQHHQKWNSATGQWQACTVTGWVSNQSNNDRIEIIVNETKNTPFCGAGWYQNQTELCAKAPTTSSHGGWSCQSHLSSGYHWLPN